MDKQNAIQDISYIRQLMNKTQQIMDITWPIYVYWGIFFIITNINRLIFSYNSTFVITFDHVLTLPEISMVAIMIASWVGIIFAALYIYHHRKQMFNQKMFLIGMLGLSFLLIYITITVSLDIIWFSSPTIVDMFPLHNLYGKLIFGLYFAALFIVFGLVYAREQLWMGYWLLVVTIVTMYIGGNQIATGNIQISTQLPIYHILFGNVGICFLIAGMMAYRRHKKQINENKQVVI